MTSSPLFLAALMLAAGVLPFALVMLTSFVKMAVVLSIARSAIGSSGAPPNVVITGLALVLTMSVMEPVGSQVLKRLDGAERLLQQGDLEGIKTLAAHAAEPLGDFLRRHTDPQHLQALARSLKSEEEGGWKTLVPAYVITQLHQAFRLGFNIYLPFLVLDLLVASILLALGMHMLSPTAVSLPLKLLLFVFADGWTVIGTNLIGSYQ